MNTLRLLAISVGSLLTFFGTHSALAGVINFGSGANQFNRDFVPIGNPGNAADTTGAPNPAGAVGYNFQMGTHEVSRDMIMKANAAGFIYGISLLDMTSFGGNGVNKPATGVSWNEATRFVNWLNTSTGGFAAYKEPTLPPGYNIIPTAPIALWTPADTLDFNPLNPFRSLRATYVLPTVDEWYKAAYYNPITGAYSDFPNGSDTPPLPVTSGTTANTAVYGPVGRAAGPADVTQAGGLSPFGVMGMGGNVEEWNETESDLMNDNVTSDRVYRGGFWPLGDTGLLSSTQLAWSPNHENNLIGFRVAMLSPAAVPEPGSLAIFGIVSVGCWLYSKRRERQ